MPTPRRPCAMCGELRRQIARLEAQTDALQNALIARTIPTVTTTVALPPRAPDPVADAIRVASGTDAALRKHLFTWVKAERAKPEGDRPGDDVLCDRILHWAPGAADGVPAIPASDVTPMP